jgi:uncharacterized membrane protein YphA (DoxX/SURF4 family)
MIDRIVLVVRVGLGVMLAAAGVLKIGHADEFAAQIAGFQLLPKLMIAPLALLLPFLETMVGAYLIAGLFARFAAWFTAAEMALFAGAIGSAVARGIHTSCGCFGPSDQTMTSWPEAARDLGLAALAAFVALRAPGALALDRRMESPK